MSEHALDRLGPRLNWPVAFSPLHTANMFGQFQAILPFAGIVAPLASGLSTLLLSLQPANGYLPVLLRNCAIVLAVPVQSGTVLQSITLGNPGFGFAAFGLSFLFFAAVALAPTLLGNIRRADERPGLPVGIGLPGA
jgi:hypothetical protein